jgi:uncharacterized protein (UPF0276 family)
MANSQSDLSKSMLKIIWALAGRRMRNLRLCARAIRFRCMALSIGGTAPLNRAHLVRLKTLCDRYQPDSFSEHLAWSSHGDIFYNDLLPLPYTEETLERIIEHIELVQTELGRQMLLENPSTYIAFAGSTIPETEFLSEVSRRSGCGLLLDINNVFISAKNHGTDPASYLGAFPLARVKEIHLGGHDEQTDDAGAPLLIDTHGSPVADPVWTLYRNVISRTGPLPTLIEWDNDVPAWSVLASEARAASVILNRAAVANAA